MSCITMEVDSEGFWYPVVDHIRCVQCDLCTEVCPIVGSTTQSELGKSLPEAYAAYNIDERLRLQSSSGGLFTLLGEMVINSGGVVFGARFDDDFNVIHDYVETSEDLYRLRGSKYVQSLIGDTFKQAQEFLECDRLVMFTGTPCQIGGLKHYLGQEYDSLICQDIVCHGVPSPKVWQKYVTYRGHSAASAIQGISFRRKDPGWKRYSLSFWFENGMEYLQTHQNDLYMKAFLRNICLRPSCHACHFKSLHRGSDITLGDFWGIRNILPAMDDDKGTSLVVVHTETGQELLNRVQSQTKLRAVDLEAAIKYNSSMVESAKVHPAREAFFASLDNERIDLLIAKYCRDRLPVLFKRILVSVSRRMLKGLGLLGKAKSVLLRHW